MIGKVFGRLTVIDKAPKTDKNSKWNCICSCGNRTVVRGSNLKAGQTRSCGCLNRETATKHGGVGTRLYRTWESMRRRCNNKNTAKYPDYGGRGISYPPEWDDFSVFKKWALSSGYDDTLTIERIDVNKSYSEDNCTWADRFTQAANRRKMSNKSSKYIGVYERGNDKWGACIKVKYKNYYLGQFDSELEAAKCRDAFIKSNNLPHKLNF